MYTSAQGTFERSVRTEAAEEVRLRVVRGGGLEVHCWVECGAQSARRGMGAGAELFKSGDCRKWPDKKIRSNRNIEALLPQIVTPFSGKWEPRSDLLCVYVINSQPRKFDRTAINRKSLIQMFEKPFPYFMNWSSLQEVPVKTCCTQKLAAPRSFPGVSASITRRASTASWRRWRPSWAPQSWSSWRRRFWPIGFSRPRSCAGRAASGSCLWPSSLS